MENKKSFGEFILAKRKDQEMTQKAFAEKLHVTESAVSKWERGLSYPDITLIRDICGVLEISEHELLTASDDTQTRTQEKQAKKFLTIKKGTLYTFYGFYIVSLVTCFICNIAIQHRLSWFFIVLASELVLASLTLVPIWVTKNKGLATLGSFTLTTLLLFMVCCLYTKGDWFWITAAGFLLGMSLLFLPYIFHRIWLPHPFAEHKALLYFIVNSLLTILVVWVASLYTGGRWFLSFGLPITLIGLLPIWACMILVRYTRINTFFKIAGCLAIFDVLEYFINGQINRLLGEEWYYGFHFDFSNWNTTYSSDNINALLFFVVLGLITIFIIAGIIRELSIVRN